MVFPRSVFPPARAAVPTSPVADNTLKKTSEPQSGLWYKCTSGRTCCVSDMKEAMAVPGGLSEEIHIMNLTHVPQETTGSWLNPFAF